MKLIRFKKKRRHSTRNISKIESLSLVKFGSFGLKTKTAGILTMKQIETIRRLLSRKTKRISKITIRIFFQHPIKKKSLLSRMGKGIGGIKSWVS
jgi:ribosomal protein L16